MRFVLPVLFCSLSLELAGCGSGGGAALPAAAGANAGAGTAAVPTLGAAHVGSSSAKRVVNAGLTNPFTSLVISDNPIAFYRLNDSGSTMTDFSTNAINGVFGANVQHGGAGLTSSENVSAVFPGSPAGSDVPSNTGTVPANALFTTASTSLTIETWIKPADLNRTNTFVPIVSYGRGAIGSAWSLQVTPQSVLDFYLKVSGGSAGSYELKPAAARFNASQIYQVVATYDGANAKLYVNGNLALSVPATGSINYSGIAPQYGLSIGGSLGDGRPIFNGAINDVSIYPTALSAAEVQKHYLYGQIVAPIVETPVSSDAFVDTIGVVTHLRSSGTPYTDSWSTFESLLKASGIRHIGDALIPTPTWYPQRLNELAASGIHARLITSLTQTSQDITSAIPIFASSIESIGGPNEPDLTGGPTWVQDTQAFQKMLWSTVKGNSATATLNVVGPSMTSVGHNTAVGDLSAYLDDGSIHDYFSGYNPGTTGWGSLDQYGIYGSLTWARNICAIVSGTKPAVSTETGYSSAPGNSGGVDSRTLARYIPRIYLEHYLHGIDRTTLYEFYDDPTNTNFSNFGLVGIDNTPKSSYYAIQSLTKTLGDPGSVFTPAPLSYVLTGNMSNVHHLLLQKRDGTYQLVLWVEVASYDPVAKTDLVVPAQTVTLQPTTLPSTASVSIIGDSGSVTTSALSFPGGVASIPVDDRVTIVSFK